MFDRGIYGADTGSYENGGAQVIPLPLNLIALIISYLDQPADLARTCRTCRVLHYMTLPQLYSNVSLRSYDYIRYSPLTGRPEGCGGASPFSMGLNGLVTRSIAGYVRKFRLWGEFKEYDLEECAKVGRVPDGSMMLNCLVRAAVEKMGVLESFSWELNTKMLPTVWQGLAQKQTLTSLAVKFPSVRLPRPTVLVPPIPSLKSLRITDIDPLCYPDDISLLLLDSRKLRDLTLHWNPRMRSAREPSVSLHAYFGRLVSRQHQLTLRSITFANLYATNNGGFDGVVDPKKLEEITFINSTGGAGDSGETAFIDLSWQMHSHKEIPSPKMIRGDKISRQHCEWLGTNLVGLERYYLIGATQPCERKSNGQRVRTPSDNVNPYPSTPVPSTPSTPIDPTAISLGKDYLDLVCKNHGSTLRHLLLKPQWRLSSEDLGRLVRCCPNLEQLGVGLEVADLDILCILMPFLPKLSALRILDDPQNGAFAEAMKRIDDAFPENDMGPELAKPEYSQLRWLGLGNMVFEVKGLVRLGGVDTNGENFIMRDIKRASREDVQHVEIWGMDSMEI
ncbi:F-box domain [Lasallia pustulata]|uniref:F-box domain n=1 Tax=Lasallia pustulata TaxID=136370 RepID=A0A1W5D068_9LECA|nr:F-box domain [Lasallia pustulata]